MNIRLLLFVFIITAGCKEKNNSSQKVSTTDTVQKTTISEQKEITDFYKWTGTINSSIPAFLWFVVKDKVIKGELTYLKTKKQLPITVFGRVNEEGFKIYEFQKDGHITGTFIGRLQGEKFKGDWYNPSTDKTLSFQFITKDTILNSVDTILQPTNISGKYSYQFGQKGYQGGIDIVGISKRLASFDISCVTSAPAFNVANVTADSIRIVNNTINYKDPESDNCQFKIRIFKDFLIIDYIDNKYDCGFGMNATVEGIFVKLK
jgi:hypothetical protein